jgi:NAD(P)-dependent dehydrogenase (short-subunit alcohol dehydrogenase family)
MTKATTAAYCQRPRVHALFDLSDQVAVVTGGSRGIGLAIAEGLVDAGARVVIASRNPKSCHAAAAALVERGGQAVAAVANMGELSACTEIVHSALDHFGRLDIVVNNAAIALTQPLGEVTPEAWEKVYAVDVRGPLFLVQAALPQLRTAQTASVINVVSPGAFTFAASTALYSSAKAALVSLTRSMAQAFAADGIRVNALSPGPTDTDMVRNNDIAQQQRFAQSTLMGRLADPHEMVGPAMFLASRASSFMTGQVLTVDGGMVAR